MGGLFPPKESSSQDDGNVSDGGEGALTQDASETDTPPDTKMVVDDDENPF